MNISGFNVTGATGGDEAGIYLSYANHSNVSDNTASNNTVGISLSGSGNNNITSNTASNNIVGISLSESGNNNITSNTASNNTVGIGLDHSDYNSISSNTASANNWTGIGLQDSNYNTIASNTASANNEYGIGLDHSDYNNISDNTAANNGYGIYLSSSCNNNELTSNSVNSNNDYGIYLFFLSSDNLIYDNYFNNTHNAYDNGNNAWNITKTIGTNIIGGPYLGGNYWSDYAGVDNDGDGLGNTLLPYNSSGNITTGGDWHPLVQGGFGPPNITSFAPPSPVNDTVCNWRAFNVTVNQTVNVSWYLNNTLRHTNVSTKEANYTLHAEVVGEHNVSAIASNANGMDMQTWVWNVTVAPVLNCTCGDICVDPTGWWRDGGAFNASNTPIQHAIDNATAGDTICVKDGTYNENVDVTKSHLTIRSANGPSVTTVSASLNHNKHVFRITNQTNVTLKGFEIRDHTARIKTWQASTCTMQASARFSTTS